MTTRTFAVPGMTCGHCQASIEQEVGKLSGVERVDVDLDSKTVTVDGTAGAVQVREAIEAAGFDVTTS